MNEMSELESVARAPMNARQRIICIYHDNCLDGLAAAWAVKEAYREESYVDITYIAAKYGDDPGHYDVEWNGATVFIVDFSFPPEILAEILALDCDEVIFLDHHKTAIEAYKDWVPADLCQAEKLLIQLDDSQSGALLTWDFLFPLIEEAPDFLIAVSDRDLWKFEMAYTKEICAGLASTLYSREEFFKLCDKLFAEGISAGFLQYGYGILVEQAQCIERCMKSTHPVYIEAFGHGITSCNAPYFLASEIGNQLAEKNDHQVALVYSMEGEIVNCSLRSVGDVDCEEIAKAFGGGGHKNAAGFKMSIQAWAELF